MLNSGHFDGNQALNSVAYKHEEYPKLLAMSQQINGQMNQPGTVGYPDECPPVFLLSDQDVKISQRKERFLEQLAKV